MRTIQTVFLCFCVMLLLSQQKSDTGFQLYYDKAVALYDEETPTPESEKMAINYFNTAIQLLEGKPKYRFELLNCYVKAGNIYQGQQKYKEALPFYHRGLQLASSAKDNLFLYQFQLYLGSAKYSLNEIDSARFLFEKASVLAERNKAFPDLTILYNSLGIIYYESANFRQAINYFEKAVNGLSADDETYDESYVSFKNNIAGCYLQLNEYRKALEQYLLLIPYEKISSGLLQNIGHTYYDLKMYDSCLFYLHKVRPAETLTYARLLNEKARVFMHKGKLSLSEQLFDSAIHIIRKIPGYYKNKDKAKSYLYRSQLADKQQLYNEAISWCNIALQELHFSFKAQRAIDLPAKVNDVVSPIVFFEVLQQKALLLHQKFLATNEIQWGKAALQAWVLAVKTANYIKSDFDNDEASLFFNTNYSSQYKAAASLAAKLYEQTGSNEFQNAFLLIAETYKGNVLYLNLNRNSAKSSGIIPDSLLTKEYQLKQLLAVFTNRLNTAVSKEGAKLIQVKLTDIHVQLSRLHRQFESFEGYKSAAQMTYVDTFVITDVQKKLPKGKALLQLIWLDTAMIALTVTNEKSSLKQIKLNAPFLASLKQSIHTLYEPREGIRFAGYESLAAVYQFLNTALPAFFWEQKQWVLLPDGVLNYLPFETLITDISERRYLAENKIISYHYSLSVLFARGSMKPGLNNTFAAAPFYKEGITTKDFVFPSLPYSDKEIDIWEGEKMKGATALKSHFMKTASQAQIIHLATHALATADSGTGSQTFIQFYAKNAYRPDFSRLYIHELYSMRFAMQPLVILSACETAAGVNGGGEGLLSLSRAFLYGGCSGIISTLWKAEDRVTAYIIKQTHTYLQKNYSVEEALFRARTDFLKDETMDARFKTPDDWGHLIYIGAADLEQGVIDNRTSSKWTSVVLIIILLYASFWYVNQYLSKKN